MTDNIIRITIRVREDLFMKMKLLAAARDTTLTEVLNEATEEYIRSHEEEIKKRISSSLSGVVLYLCHSLITGFFVSGSIGNIENPRLMNQFAQSTVGKRLLLFSWLELLSPTAPSPHHTDRKMMKIIKLTESPPWLLPGLFRFSSLHHLRSPKRGYWGVYPKSRGGDQEEDFGGDEVRSFIFIKRSSLTLMVILMILSVIRCD